MLDFGDFYDVYLTFVKSYVKFSLSMRNWLLALLLLLLGTEGGVSLAHKHEDGKLHLDCTLCIIEANPQKEENPKVEPKRAGFLSVYIELQVFKEKVLTITLKHTQCRAPPAKA
jgi:hypothetical protein